MTAAASELQKAVFAALNGDVELTALMGGAGKVYDHAPAAATFPYITFGRTSIFDWSTGTELGSEHLFTLHVWSKTKGKKEALEIMERAKWRLDDASLPLEGQQLVSMRLEFAEARYDDDQSVHHGLLRFRALIEETA